MGSELGRFAMLEASLAANADKKTAIFWIVQYPLQTLFDAHCKMTEH